MTIINECPNGNEGIYRLLAGYGWAISKRRQVTLDITPRSSKLEYRYPPQSYEDITADRYEVETLYDIKSQNNYAYFVTFNCVINGKFPAAIYPVFYQSGQVISLQTRHSYYGITRSRLRQENYGRFAGIRIDYMYKNAQGVCLTASVNDQYFKNEDYNNRAYHSDPSDLNTIGITDIFDINLTIDASKPAIDCKAIQNNPCKFSAYQCDRLVLQRTEDNCPEVIERNCFEDNSKESTISFELAPLEILFVLKGKSNSFPFYIELLLKQTAFFNGVFFSSDFLIPLRELAFNNRPECLTVVKLINFRQLSVIAQVCSSCNCDAPDYQITCDFTEDCPPNTCKVDCVTHFCCYNSEGISLKSIPK